MGGKRKLPESGKPRLIKKHKAQHKVLPKSSHRAARKHWNKLSKRYVTLRSMDEFDRRMGRKNAHHPPLPDPSQLSLPADLSALKRFSRHGGPDLSDIRGYRNPCSGDNLPIARPRVNQKNIRWAAYDRNFQQALYDNGIRRVHRVVNRPNNWDAIQKRMAKRRPSLSSDAFGEDELDELKPIFRRARTESRGRKALLKILRGEERGILHKENQAFGNMEAVVPSEAVAARPHSYDGALPAQLDRNVLGDLDEYLIPSMGCPMLILPNFSVLVKRTAPKKAARVAIKDRMRREALHHGVHGARAMHRLQNYGENDGLKYDNNAYAITITYRKGILGLHTVHPIPSSNPTARPTDYVMNELISWAVTNTLLGFRNGVTAFRNLREWAEEQRVEFIHRANEKVSVE